MRNDLAGVIAKHCVSFTSTSLTIAKNGAVDAVQRTKHNVLAGHGVNTCIWNHFSEATIEGVNFATRLHLCFFWDWTLMVGILAQRCVAGTENWRIINYPLAGLEFWFHVVRALTLIIRSHSQEDLDVFFFGLDKCWLAAGGEWLNWNGSWSFPQVERTMTVLRWTPISLKCSLMWRHIWRLISTP